MSKVISENGAYVRIQSTKTINVTMGLQNQDVTNPDAHVPDRLKVNPLWPKLTVLIKEGVHWYPSEIAEWNTVKALANDKILTIGEFANEVDDEELKKASEKLNANIASVEAKIEQAKPRRRRNVQPSLANIANEEETNDSAEE